MTKHLAPICLVCACLSALLTAAENRPTDVGLKDRWFMVNGERFFVRGIGYELGGGRGGIPGNRSFDPGTMEYDLALMKNAGFNTVRAWNAYTPEELEVLRKHGMMVIQGAWVDIPTYLLDKKYARQSRERLAAVVHASKEFDNILFYTIGNEPPARPIIDAGLDAYSRACRELKAAMRHEDPTCRVTYSHCSRNEFFPQNVWDVVFFNDYMYAPKTVQVALKYRCHIEWLIRKYAARKPFVVGEFGLSVSKRGTGHMGYGGNTLEEQRDGDLRMYQALIDAGSQGGCLFMWKDGWWKHGAPETHDDHPEEWYGVLAIDDRGSDPRGTPRPVYYAFRRYNQLILTEPRQMVVYPVKVPVDAYVTENVKEVRCRVDGGPWAVLATASPSWRRGSFGHLAPGRHSVEVAARLNLEDIKEVRRVVDFIVGDPAHALPKITLNADKPTYAYGETAVVRVRAVAGDGAPVQDLGLAGTFQDHGNGQGRTFEGKTDANGVFATSFPLFLKPTFITLAVGADVQAYDRPTRLTDATVIQVTGTSPADLEGAARRQGRLVEGFEYKTKANLDRVVGRVLAGGAKFSVDLETAHVKQGATALALHLTPKARYGWGYTEVFFDGTRDLSRDVAVSYWLYGDGSRHSVKVMLIDKDSERWLDDPVLVDFKGWRQILFSPKALQRDPFDGIRDGDGRPNPDRIGGLAFAVVAGSDRPSTVVIDAVMVHR